MSALSVVGKRQASQFAFSTTVFVVYHKNAPNCRNLSPEAFACAFATRGAARRWANDKIGVNRHGRDVYEIIRVRVPVHDCDED